VKVLHVPFLFAPDPMGGTEVYVEALARRQQRDGIAPIVAAPSQQEMAYRHGDLLVRRFPVSDPIDDLRTLYGDGDRLAADGFARILDAESPDVVHLHAFTPAVSLRLVRDAKSRGIPVVFSYHTPTVSCQRGTLLRWGVAVCDGALDVRTCTQCSLHGLGLRRTVSTAAGWIPRGIGRLAGSAGLSGGIWTAVRMTELVALRQAAFRALVQEVNHIVAMCQWVKDLLVRNGVPARRITLSRQGVDRGTDDVAPRRTDAADCPIRVVFIARLDPTKGAHVLIEAIKAAPELSLTLDIYGVSQGEQGAVYLEQLRRLADGDRRITFQGALPAHEVVKRMRDYDVLAVPSLWLETGPLVILEAFATGLPVIGSNLGGIAELVTSDVDGVLVEPHTAAAWRAALERVTRDRELLERLRRGIRQPRTIADVAADMSALYASLS
jgi:glycosyltransferase involved in cell wall biosynthesis